jgi:hypothetical protein
VVRDVLAKHPKVHFHFTPTYWRWLNQVEIWFSKVERHAIARGIFTSVKDLARKLRRYINAYSASAKPKPCWSTAIGGTLAQCDLFGIPSWMGAAIIVQCPRTKTCIVTRPKTSTRPMPSSLAG